MSDNYARKIWYGVTLFLLMVIQVFLVIMGVVFPEPLAGIVFYGLVIFGAFTVYVGARFLIIMLMSGSEFLTSLDTWLSRLVKVMFKVLIFLRIGRWIRS